MSSHIIRVPQFGIKGHYTKINLSKEDGRRNNHKHKNSHSYKQKHDKHHKHCDYDHDHKKQWSDKHHQPKLHEVSESDGSKSDVCSCTSTSSNSNEERYTCTETVDQLSFMIESIQIKVDNVTHETEAYADLLSASDMKFQAKVETKVQANIMPVHARDKIIGTRSHLRLSHCPFARICGSNPAN